MNSIIDDLEIVIARLRTVVDGPPYFIYGDNAELNKRLITRGRAAKEKYPLIYLKLDFPEVVDGNVIRYDLNLGVMTYTKENYTVVQRRDLVFKPILVPLYQDFIKGVRTAGKFMWPGEQTAPPHTAILRPFWGVASSNRNVKNKTGDPLDCIEIVNMRINKRIKCN